MAHPIIQSSWIYSFIIALLYLPCNKRNHNSKNVVCIVCIIFYNKITNGPAYQIEIQVQEEFGGDKQEEGKVYEHQRN